jgi:hypothetical protein
MQTGMAVEKAFGMVSPYVRPSIENFPVARLFVTREKTLTDRHLKALKMHNFPASPHFLPYSVTLPSTTFATYRPPETA